MNKITDDKNGKDLGKDDPLFPICGVMGEVEKWYI